MQVTKTEVSEYNRQYYAAHADRERQRARAYRLKNHALVLEKKRLAYPEYYAKHGERLRAKNRLAYTRRVKGITDEQLRALFEAQGKCCKACKSPNPLHKNGWHIDHDHSCCEGMRSCGKCIRGILCGPCNMALGFAKEDAERLIALAAYISGYSI